jgi:hypothetical protein
MGMQELTFWKAVIVDQSNFLEAIIAMLSENNIRYCVIGGQGVNAYVDPLVSLDLDLVVAAEQLDNIESLLSSRFKLERFPHSLNVTGTDSKLRVQIQTDPRYSPFVRGARQADVLGLTLPVATFALKIPHASSFVFIGAVRRWLLSRTLLSSRETAPTTFRSIRCH